MNKKVRAQERYYQVLPTLQDLLNHAMEEFEEYNPDFLQHTVTEANRIIDEHLGPMARHHPRYAYFDHISEIDLQRHHGIAYLDAFEGIGGIKLGFSYQLYDDVGLYMLEESSNKESLTTYKTFKTYNLVAEDIIENFGNLKSKGINTSIIFSYDYFFSIFEIEENDSINLHYLN